MGFQGENSNRKGPTMQDMMNRMFNKPTDVFLYYKTNSGGKGCACHENMSDAFSSARHILKNFSDVPYVLIQDSEDTYKITKEG